MHGCPTSDQPRLVAFTTKLFNSRWRFDRDPAGGAGVTGRSFVDSVDPAPWRATFDIKSAIDIEDPAVSHVTLL